MQKRRKRGKVNTSRTPRPAPRLRSAFTPPPKSPDLVDKARQYVREFKRFYNTCADCLHEWPPFVLEFDHVDPSTKRFNVGDASSVPSLEALEEEIQKCDLVCANCHKIREYRRKRTHQAAKSH